MDLDTRPIHFELVFFLVLLYINQGQAFWDGEPFLFSLFER